jgi:molybdopterin molybdotransferase
MISVEQARARILASLQALPAEIVPLPEAAHRVLAAPVVARLTQPPADVSAMDGYAVQSASAQENATLHVIGEAPAGHPFAGTVGPGEAVRLFTGSVIPAGADAVLVQEDATPRGDTIVVGEAVPPGRHVRPRGQDFAEGETVLHPGQRLTAFRIGLAAAANDPWLAVHRRPRVAILATGDEIALPGEPLPHGGIVSSNSHMLAAMVRGAGGFATILPVARDTEDAIAAAAETALGADLLLTTGGASVGDHDVVQAGLARHGFALDFWKIAMRPGKPMIFGHIGVLPVLGLPGNPVSAGVCAVLFLLPALRRLQNLPADPPATVLAFAGAKLRANDHRADHLRATLSRDSAGHLVATPFPRQDSGMLSLLAQAQCLVLRAPHAPAIEAGDPVEIILLESDDRRPATDNS